MRPTLVVAVPGSHAATSPTVPGDSPTLAIPPPPLGTESWALTALQPEAFGAYCRDAWPALEGSSPG